MRYPNFNLAKPLWLAGMTLAFYCFVPLAPTLADDLVGFTSGSHEAPKTNVGGGRRVDDVCKDLNMSTLQPYVGVLTTSHDRPVLLAAIPPELGATHIFLNLTNEAGEELYHGTLPLQQFEDGVGLVLPQEVPALGVGESYHWSAALICNSESNLLNPDDPVISGVVERVETPD